MVDPDALEAACRAYLLEQDIDPDFPRGLDTSQPLWWITEKPQITAAINAYLKTARNSVTETPEQRAEAVVDQLVAGDALDNMGTADPRALIAEAIRAAETALLARMAGKL